MLAVNSYVILNVMAALVICVFAWVHLRRVGLKPLQIGMTVVFMVVLFIVGSRLFYGILYLPKMMENPTKWFEIKWVNFSLYGGLVLCLGGWYWITRVYKLPFLELTDRIIPGLGLAVALSKMGCFFNGCCYGVPTSLPWGVVFSRADQTPLTKAFGGSPFIKMISGAHEVLRHPTQLYEVFFALLATLLALYLLNRVTKGVKAGEATLGFILVLTAGRWISFGFRAFPSASSVSNFIRGPVTYGLILSMGIVMLIVLKRKKE